MTRAEHIEWVKQRARTWLAKGKDPRLSSLVRASANEHAAAGIIVDLKKHPETAPIVTRAMAMMARCASKDHKLEQFIEDLDP